MPAQQAPATQGRPKDPAKRAAIIAAAMVLFGRRPYNMVTMEAVAAEADVSKMTIYSHFSDKESLCETVVLTVSDRFLTAFPAATSADRPLAERLTTIGSDFLTVILGADVANMAHTLTMALRSDPALAQRFYDAGPGRATGALAAIIEAAAARGELLVDDPHKAAEDLLSLWEGGMPIERAFGLAVSRTPGEIDGRVRRGTEVFLRAYANAPTGGPAAEGKPAGPTPSRRRRT